MFRKTINNAATVPANKPPAGRKSIPSVISADMSVLGNIVSDGTVDLDGTLDGNIRCNCLVLRQNAKVTGEIHAESVQVHGRVKGLIKARSVHLHATCSVEGIIMHEVISIEDGAMIDGKFKRTNKAASAVSNDMPEEGDIFGADADEDTFSSQQVMDNIRLIAG